MATRVRGVVVVTLTNIRDNNSFVESIENQFCEVVRDLESKDGVQFRMDGKTVVWQVDGTCQFRFGIEQHVQLNEKALTAEDGVTSLVD